MVVGCEGLASGLEPQYRGQQFIKMSPVLDL